MRPSRSGCAVGASTSARIASRNLDRVSAPFKLPRYQDLGWKEDQQLSNSCAILSLHMGAGHQKILYLLVFQ